MLRGGRVFLLFLTARNAFSSKLYGWWQSRSWTRRKVLPFIEKFGIDPQEFLHPVESFSSFNDFFIRKLKKRARPIASRTDTAILPADGRYLLIPDLCDTVTTLIKGQEISLLSLLGGDLRGDTEKTKKRLEQYRRGSLLIARLCPIDYHRFHFPCEGTPGEAVLQEGSLYSVNPFALRQRLSILGENRRVVTSLQTKQFGEILYIEVGATHVGSIHQTYTPHKLHKKGEEKGFFSFGGSCLLLFFEPDVITWDKDLLQASGQGLELRGLMGEGMGVARRSS